MTTSSSRLSRTIHVATLQLKHNSFRLKWRTSAVTVLAARERTSNQLVHQHYKRAIKIDLINSLAAAETEATVAKNSPQEEKSATPTTIHHSYTRAKLLRFFGETFKIFCIKTRWRQAFVSLSNSAGAQCMSTNVVSAWLGRCEVLVEHALCKKQQHCSCCSIAWKIAESRRTQ